MPSFKLSRLMRPALLACALGLLAAPSAQAQFGLEDFAVRLSEGGQFSRQAGAHPDLHVHLAFARTAEGAPDGNAHEVRVDLPPGLLGNPTNFPSCEFSDLLPSGAAPTAACPIGSQVGWAVITTLNTSPVDSGDINAAVYNMRRPNDGPALLGINAASAAVVIEPRLRAGDYAITSFSRGISQGLTPFYVNVDLWGVPADPAHDALRLTPPAGPHLDPTRPTPSPELRRPFLSAPTACSGAPLEFKALADSWQDQGVFASASVTSDRDGIPLVMTGCDQVPFNPTASITPASGAAASPSGVDVDLHVPQGNSPDGLATAHVKKTVVRFPEGVTVSPGSAAGQGACSEAEIAIGTNAAPTCPDSSRIGTVEIATPLLDETLTGSLYLATPHDNPFGSLLATYLAVKGPGFFLKLPGEVESDPATGQLTATFDDQPQLPYEDVSVSLRGGPGAPLTTPPACGTYATRVEMTSWASSVPVVLSSPMRIDQGCETGGFAPDLKAGTTNPIAGAYSPFLLRIARKDGEQNLARVETTLPEGLLAKLSGVPICADPQAAAGACSPASRVGTTTVAAGAGPTPLYLPEAGKEPTAIYLAGPYKGAPFSLLFRVPAQAGPFDLGTVLVRAAIFVDPRTAQVTAKSDPLPQILEAIPIAYRDIRVEVTRPDFTLNPTSCKPMKVTSTIASAAGQIASPSPRFQVANCERLGFKPKLSLSLAGGTKRGQNPALKAVLKARKGDANIGRASVALPHSEFLAQNHIKTICTRVQFAAKACPAGSIYGFATATTPLLDAPLSGPVYLRSSSNPLPDLVAALHGQIDVDLVGRIDSKNGGIRTTFSSVPDVPVSKFVFSMQGGKKGLLENSKNLCASTNKADVRFAAQNGKTADSTPVLTNGCTQRRR